MNDEEQPKGRRGRGGGSHKTLIIVLVVVLGGGALLGIALLVGGKTPVFPQGFEVKDRIQCMNNLRLLSDLLVARHSVGNLKRYDGPAFLLQVAPDVADEDLAVFLCPGEPEGFASGRPAVGSPEFIRMYRDLTEEDLSESRDWSRYTSYAGPDLKNFPVNRYWPEGRLWACDRCPGGKPHHLGVAVLQADTRVDFLAPEHVKGFEDGRVIVGPGAPDQRLKKMSVGGGK